MRIKQMMAESYTIEQIQREFFFVRSELSQLEQSLGTVFSILKEVVRERRHEGYAQDVARDLEGARGVSRDLLGRLLAIESRLTTRAKLRRVSAS